MRIVKATIAAHTEDGQLQYRGVNLLERLQPGCTLEMPKQAMIRSYSMRAEEMVSQYRITARSFVASSASQAAMAASEGSVSSAAPSRHTAEASKAAIAEVDEMAEAVEHEEEKADSRAAAATAAGQQQVGGEGAGAEAAASSLPGEVPTA